MHFAYNLSNAIKYGSLPIKLKFALTPFPYLEIAKIKAFRDSERLLLCLIVMRFYLLLRYTANPNANAPKIAATVAGSGTCIEINNAFPLML